MTKKEIVKSISEELGLTQLKTKEIVQRTFDAIIDALAAEGRIELRNFGVFEVKRRAARTARNPRSGDQVEVPEKCVVTFKPGKEMEARVARTLSRDGLQGLTSNDGDDAKSSLLPESQLPPKVQPDTEKRGISAWTKHDASDERYFRPKFQTCGKIRGPTEDPERGKSAEILADVFFSNEYLD